MPGFSQWAGRAGGPERAAAAEESYVVLNDLLKSTRNNGLRFRRSPKIDDLAQRLVRWGATVRGAPHGAEWLKVGELYLPFYVSGQCVLFREDDEAVEDLNAPCKLPDQRWGWPWLPAYEEPEDKEKSLEGRHRQAEAAAEPPEAEEAEPKAEERPEEAFEFDDYILDQEGNPLLPSWLSKEEHVQAPPAPEGSPPQRLLSVLIGEEFAGQPTVAGQPFEVIVEQEKRQVPSKKARVFGKVVKGQRLLLYKWDATGHWRTVWQEGPLRSWAWLEMDDPEAGPLLRPLVPSHTTKLRHWKSFLDNPRAVLDPVCLTVFENDPGHLQSFVCLGFNLNARDPGGLTPLMLAAQWGLVECCVLLLRGGASARLCAPDGRRAMDFAREAPVRALLEALLGEESFDAKSFDEAMQKMRPELQELAEAMLEEVVAALRERRRREQEAAAELARIKALEARLLAERGADGARFEVVAQFTVMRQEASVDSPILGELPKGRVVELFDWSLNAQWRKCWHPLVTRRPPILYTWVMVDDPDHGPLLRPHTSSTEEVLRPWPAASASCLVPLQPACMAVHENNLGYLQNLALTGVDLNAPDSKGFSPLMLAAQWGLFDCCVRLLHDGADAFQQNPECQQASDLARDPELKALIRWLSGEDPKLRCYAVLERLAPDLQECAENMLKDLAAKREAKRKAEEEAAAKARRAAEREEAERKERAAKQLAEKQKAQQQSQDPFSLDFLGFDRASAYTLAELDEMKAKKDFEEQEMKVAAGLLEAWTCSDCAFQSPASSPVCVFCDTPRGGGLKEAHLQGRRA